VVWRDGQEYRLVDQEMDTAELKGDARQVIGE
jgi:hypothetical protein